MYKTKLFIFFIIMVMFVSGCATSRGNRALVSDIGNGTTEYRAIQGDIRSGEAELAITGTKLEGESRELRNEISQIGDGIRELEQAISGSQRTTEEVRTILQRIREREIDPALIEEWRNSWFEAGSNRPDIEDGKS